MNAIAYYAIAERSDGRIGQVLVTVTPHPTKKSTQQEWTGVIYKSVREAYRDLERLNCRGEVATR